MPSKIRRPSRTSHDNSPSTDQPNGKTAKPQERVAREIATILSARPTIADHPVTATATTSRSAPATIAVKQPPTSKEPPFSSVPNNEANITTARRIVRSKDILNPKSGIPRETLWQQRALAATRLYLAFDDIKAQLKVIRESTPERALPRQLSGIVIQPDGSKAVHVQLELTLASFSTQRTQITTTNDLGEFTLAIPTGAAFPSTGLELAIRGANRTVKTILKSDQVAPNGFAGNILLKDSLQPLPLSIVAGLKDLLPTDRTSELPAPVAPAVIPAVMIGEEGECARVFNSNLAVERFPFSIFVRLIEPRTSIVSPVIRFFPPGLGKKFFPVTDYFPLSENNDVVVSYVDRVPVDQPISVDGFRDQLIGVGDGTTASPFETVAMAGTLGLGYVLQLSQKWAPRGLALGNLVYSLPLAPGEQQRVAMFDRQDTSQTFESESLSVAEQQRFEQLTDASTEAIFSSAFSESARGGSRFDTESSNWGVGGSIIIFSAGGGGSSSSGSSSSWLQGQRNYASRAVEDVHTNLQRQAAASRRLARTGMRLASATESADVTTKVITNHNHTHALTLQYWEVQRLFEVTTHVDGAMLVCLVPLELIRFLPMAQPRILTKTAAVDTPAEILQRYAAILSHADVLARVLPRQYQHGLTLLRQFAADPTASVKTTSGAVQDIIHIAVTGTFLPFEDIYATPITRRGTRLGTVQLSNSIDQIPDDPTKASEAFATQDALMAELRKRRTQAEGYSLAGDVALPPSLARNDIIGFELTRRFRPFDYLLVNPAMQVWSQLKALGINVQPDNPPNHLVSGTVHLTPRQLEEQLGGPFIWNFEAKIHALNSPSEETYVQGYFSSNTRHQLPPGPFPVPAAQLAPVLGYTQLLEIEQVLQHVISNTVPYSKAVWQSLTSEERAIMLEGFTIGVPTGGIVDDSQSVPLLNCVENRVLGFFGNSMIMPFMIPRSVADEMGITSAQVQDALTDFHRNGFSPPTTTVALPTRGVLGEAVLGRCPSAEKIDLTRFWNWADAPADNAPEVSPVVLPTTQPSLVAGAQGPAQLPAVPPLINNINANPVVPGADAALLQGIVKAASEQKDFSTDLTGAATLGQLIKNTQDVGSQARADAFKTTKDLTAQAIATLGNLYGGTKGNPQAGSQAASALYGTKDAAKTNDKPADKPADKSADKPAQKTTEKPTP